MIKIECFSGYTGNNLPFCYAAKRVDMNEKIKRYSRIKYTLAIIDIVFLMVILAIFQLSGLAVWLRVEVSGHFSNQILLISVYCFILFLLYSVINFPLGFYRSYKLEHRFGLSRENFLHWFGDQIKEFIVGFIIFIILVEGLLYFLRYHPDNWWWISGLFWILFSLVLARVFPSLIIPLFFKYTRVGDENLRQRILTLASRMGLRILDVYQIDFSKKTTKANAALVGLGRSKRVILTDTLQGKFSPDEIEVILAHEFAHTKLKHIIKMLILNAVIIMVTFYIFFKSAGMIFSQFDLNLADIAGLSIWIFCFTFLQICLTPLLNWISRNMERSADALAIQFTQNRLAFISMMEKLSQQNLAERKPAKWIKILFFDHPPIAERIAIAESTNYTDKELKIEKS
jgi:STE24 endopeptidase